MSFDTQADPYRAILGLRVVRRYLPEPLSPEDAAAILEAGRWTGSAKNRQDWAFIVVDDPHQKSRLAECGQFSQPLRDAPYVVVPVRLPGGYEFDIGRLSQNMMLAASTRGVGSCPVTLHDEACAAGVLEVPADHQARYALCFGYPDMEAEAESRSSRTMGGRKSLEELVRRDHF